MGLPHSGHFSVILREISFFCVVFTLEVFSGENSAVNAIRLPVKGQKRPSGPAVFTLRLCLNI